MKKKRKILVLLPLLVLFCSVGCGNPSESDMLDKEAPSTERIQKEQAPQDEENLSEAKDHTDNSITWVINDADLAARLQEPLNRLLAEKGISFTVSIRGITPDTLSDDSMSYYNRIKERKENGIPTDLFYLPMTLETDSDYYAAVKDGLFAPLALGEDEPFLKETLLPFALERVKIDGTAYGLCGMPEYFHFGIGFNQHYLKKHAVNSESLSGDLQRNGDLLYEISQKEPELLTPLAYWGLTEDELGYEYLFPSCAVGFSRQNGTEMVNVFAEEAAGEYLHTLKQLRDQKLITFLNIDGFRATEKENGYFAIAYHESKAEASAGRVIGFSDPDGKPLTTDIWFVPGQDAVSLPVISRGDITGIASWSKHPEEAYLLLKLLFTDADVANLVKFGEEGVDYRTEDGAVSEVLTQEINIRANSSYINDLLTYPMPQEPKDKKDNWENYFKDQGVHPLAGFQFDPSAVMEEIEATNAIIRTDRTVGNSYTAMLKSLLSADVPDMDRALSELNEKLEQAGISKIVAEANRQVQEWLQKKE